jgi:Putative zinc-finger
LVKQVQLHCFGRGRVARVCQGTGEMSCKDTIHLICWYLERKLSPSVENEIERHLSQCRDCHLVLDAANSTLDRYFEPAREPNTAAVTGIA